jgi:hypothetical protein
MILTLAIALVLGGWRALKLREANFYRLSVYHRSQLKFVYGHQGYADFDRLLAATESERAKDRWHLELAHKYWNAASHPWLPVPPDPPEPR